MFLASFILFLINLRHPPLDNAVVHFKVKHLGALEIRGTFDHVRGNLTQIADNEWSAKGHVVVASIETGNSSRDETILTEQYLDAITFPTIPFKAKIVRGRDFNIMTLDLKVRGIEFQLNAELYVENEEIVSKPMILNREEIGLNFGMMDALVGNEMEIVIRSGVNYNYQLLTK